MPRAKRITEQCTFICPNGKRCRRNTQRGPICYAHMQSSLGLRVKKSGIPTAPGNHLGLYAIKDMPANQPIVKFNGLLEKGIAPQDFAIQIDKDKYRDGNPKKTNKSIGAYCNICGLSKANTKLKRVGDNAILKTIKDVPKNTELCRLPTNFKPEVKKRRVLIRPIHGPEPLAFVIPDDPRPRHIPPKPKALPKSKHEKSISRNENYSISRLKVINKLFADEKLAQKLKIPLSKKVIAIPIKQKHADEWNYSIVLDKLLKKAKADLMAYFNKNPRNAMTLARLNAIVEQAHKRK